MATTQPTPISPREELGVIWLPTESAVHRNPQPNGTRAFLQSVGVDPEARPDDRWRLFDAATVNALPAEQRPSDWVVLFDPHAEFRSSTELLNKFDERVSDLLAAPDGRPWRGALAICSGVFANVPAATPLPTDPAELEKFRRAEPSFRRNEFYTHMLCGYQWGEIVRGARLRAFLTRAARHRHLLRLTEAELKAWRGDVTRLWDALAIALDRWSLHPSFFRGLKDHPERFLDTLARIHVLGRWAQESAEAFLDGVDTDGDAPRYAPDDARYTGVAWLHGAPGGFAMKEQLGGIHKEAWIDLQVNGKVPVFGPNKNDRAVLYRLRKHHVRAAGRNILHARTELYGMLRDMARCLSRGAAQWAARSREDPEFAPKGPITREQWGALSPEQQDQKKQPIRVLAIKDAATSDFKTDLCRVFQAAFREGHVYLDCLDEKEAWNTAEWWVRQLEEKGATLEIKPEYPDAAQRPAHDGAKTARSIRYYDIILLDVQYKTHFLGSQLVQWLDAQFEEAARRDQEAQPKARVRRPYLFVLTRFSHFGYMHQCMNHGAEAFISKSRLFSLPQQLTVARVGRRRLRVEARHSKPNFRTLYSLLPRAVGRLQSDQPEDLVLGDEYDRPWVAALPKADLHFHIGTSISHQTIEALALNTVGYFAQGIEHDERWQAARRPGACEPRTAIGAYGLINNVCRIVVLANVLRNWKGIQEKLQQPAQVLWTAARYVLRPPKPSGDGVIDPLFPDKDIYDEVVDWLTPKDKPNGKFETCTLLVAAVAVFERLVEAFRRDETLLTRARVLPGAAPGPEDMDTIAETATAAILPDFLARWDYLKHQGSRFPVDPARADCDAIPLDLCGQLGRDLKMMLVYHTQRVGANWQSVYTFDQITGLAGMSSAGEIWTFFRTAVEARVRAAVRLLVRRFTEILLDAGWHNQEYDEFRTSHAKPVLPPQIGDAIADAFKHGQVLTNFVNKEAPQWLEHLLTIQKLVVLPQTLDPRLRTLPRYLWGSGLLGAEHLQYPENLLLAGWDIVRQNVQDNVVYSEIRCSTNGYCDGGMNVYDATDLLCLAFDLAAVYHGVLTPEERNDRAVSQRWVRTNVLLGAKRHKKLGETQDVVSLLGSYIRRGSEVRVRGTDAPARPTVLPGQWWARCRVVGFDLSGDEKNQDPAFQKRLESALEPLFVDCTPITIHAGEAATADSIWHAVHRYGAQRIGHGLRLRENKRLLTHCINRGICMELCPISNDFTNIFDDVLAPDEHGRGYIDAPVTRREVYPLRYFLDEGLESCLNTDNRFLHTRSTLTDEYLRAAELVGGLTRWEALKVAKAGFKHAFLSKDEVAVLLRHVEFEVYKCTTDEPGGLEFPPPRDPSGSVGPGTGGAVTPAPGAVPVPAPRPETDGC